MQVKAIIALLLLVLVSANHSLLGQIFTFKGINISGNKRTREVVFLREMEYKLGETIAVPDSMAAVFQKRFSGLGLFNYVQVQLQHDTVYIVVLERIFYWAKPMLQWGDRNFNVWWQTKDPKRLIYGGTVYFNNLRGLNEQLYVTIIQGYNQQIEAGYSLPFKKHNAGWAYSVKTFWWTNHELWYKAENDRLQFLKNNANRIQENMGLELIQKKRFNYFSRIEFTQGWNRIKIDSTAYAANNNYLYDGQLQHEIFAKAECIFDRRDQRDYPTKGFLFRTGIKISQFNFMSPQRNVANAWLRMSYFKPLSEKTGTVLAAHASSNVLSREVPYRMSRQLGYQNDYVRGYEPYVGDGQGFVLGKLGIRQPLLYQRTMHIPMPRFIKTYGKIPISLWFNIFADAGKVLQPYNESVNPLSVTWYRGYGVGLDAIAWYTAMVRMEYSFNHLGKGIFNVSFKNAF